MSNANWSGTDRSQHSRSVAVLAVMGLHLCLGWLVVNGTAVRIMDKVLVPATLLLTDRAVPVPPVSPAPQSVLPKPLPAARPAPKPVAPLQPMPATPVAVSSAPVAVAAIAPAVLASESSPTTSRAVVPSVAAVAESSPAPVRTVASIRPGTCPKPPYPALSRRLEEVGTVTLRFLVGVDGKVLQSQIEHSSGFVRLDEAARNGLSDCVFQPASVDGKPEQAWATIRYAWRLE